MKNRDIRPLSRFISDMIQGKAIWNACRNLCDVCGMVQQFLVTLNDPLDLLDTVQDSGILI